ncbi:MAG: hypothetical protein ACLR6J_00080 [Parabacteroides merdae]
MGDICKGEQFFVAGTVAIYMQRLGGEIGYSRRSLRAFSPPYGWAWKNARSKSAP